MSTPHDALASSGQVSVEDMRQIPGMLPQEIAIFRAWWKDNKQHYTTWSFNVRVGKGVDPGPAYTQDQRDAAILNTQYRIDALLYQGNQPFIVEVKYRLQPLAIGQLITYRLLWEAGQSVGQHADLLVLCAQLERDMEYVAMSLGIHIVKVQADFSNTRVLKQG